MYTAEIRRWRCLGLYILKTIMADRTHLSSNQVGFVHNDDNSDYNENYNNDNNELVTMTMITMN